MHLAPVRAAAVAGHDGLDTLEVRLVRRSTVLVHGDPSVLASEPRGEWNVIGGGEPVLPGVSIGHNEFGAWGLTIFGSDTEDLYVYETNPANPNQYRYRGAWEDMRVIRDTIPVKGQASTAVDLKFTRHGPVLKEDAEHHRAYALRAAWMETGAAPYLASLRMDQARPRLERPLEALAREAVEREHGVVPGEAVPLDVLAFGRGRTAGTSCRYHSQNLRRRGAACESALTSKSIYAHN